MGVFPFGAVMGTVYAEAKVDFFHSAAMNILVFAGSSQLAAIDLMTKNAESFVVIATGLVINLRFILYSAALSPLIQRSSFLAKVFGAYLLTDQTYAVMSAQQDRLNHKSELIYFYFGAALCMALVWHISSALGFVFGNFAPKALSLDYAVPLSFVTLVVPTLKNRNYIYVTVLSSLLSLALKPVPFNLGLILSALLALSYGIWLTRKRGNL